MNTSEQFLGMLQISDSLFPIGSFTFSNGLESLAQKHLDHNDIYEFVCTCIAQQIGPTDCVGFGNAYDAMTRSDLDEIVRIDHIIHATKTAKTIRDASTRSGSQMIRCVSRFVDNDNVRLYHTHISDNTTRGTLVVASAVSACAMGLTKQQGMTCMVYSAVTGMISAALRLGLIDHFKGQEMIHSAKDIIIDVINTYIDTPISEMWQFAPQCDIIQMSHEEITSKMFNS